MSDYIVTVEKIHRRFGGEFINSNPENRKNIVRVASLNRLGMELNNVFLNRKILSIISWGNLESNFLDSISESERIKRITKILKTQPPLFLLSKNFRYTELLLNLNNQTKANIPIIRTRFSSLEIVTTLGSWLARKLAEWETIHGTAINVYGEGVLIVGSPGIGKSEIAMELLRMNHLFVGDDAIDIASVGNTILVKANALTYGFIEVRGLGILNVKEMYGIQRMISKSNIDMIIELKSQSELENENYELERLGTELRYRDLLGVKVPIYTLPISQGRKMSEIVESAVIDYKLKRDGYNAVKEFNDRLKKSICN